MVHKFDPSKLEKLLRDDRLGSIGPAELLGEEGLTGGMSFLDIGSGPGFFTLPAAKLVGEKGRAFALEVQVEMADALRDRITTEKNIEVIMSNGSEIALPDASIDFALAVFVLHEVDELKATLDETKRVLKPGGKFLVIDWEKLEQEMGPPMEDRLSFDDCMTALREAGLVITKEGKHNISNYKIKAERP